LITRPPGPTALAMSRITGTSSLMCSSMLVLKMLSGRNARMLSASAARADTSSGRTVTSGRPCTRELISSR
jgi:hypothetical protein